MYSPAVGLLAMCFVDCNSSVSVVVLCLSQGLNGLINSGYLCSHQDLAPNLAGSLMGITNTAASLTNVLAPVIVGTITQNNVRVVTCNYQTFQIGRLVSLSFTSWKVT